MGNYKVHIGIEIMKAEGGEPSVERVWSNLPPSYVEVEFFTAKATFTEKGDISFIDSDPNAGGPEFEARYPFEVFTRSERLPDLGHPGAADEWMVRIELPTPEGKQIVVLNCPTAMRAITRVLETYPDAQIISVRQLDLEDEYQQPQFYLNEECLVVNDEQAGTEPAARTRPRKKP